jgi:hypothetical protein
MNIDYLIRELAVQATRYMVNDRPEILAEIVRLSQLIVETQEQDEVQA